MTNLVSVLETESKLVLETESKLETELETVYIPRLKKIINLTIEIPTEIIQPLVAGIQRCSKS